MTRYCGRHFTDIELEQIRSLIERHPELNRTRLSKEVCQMFRWLKPDGKVKDMSCRVAMLRMERDGIDPVACLKSQKTACQNNSDHVRHGSTNTCHLSCASVTTIAIAVGDPSNFKLME